MYVRNAGLKAAKFCGPYRGPDASVEPSCPCLQPIAKGPLREFNGRA